MSEEERLVIAKEIIEYILKTYNVEICSVISGDIIIQCKDENYSRVFIDMNGDK